jgi:hypothetical protein
VIAPAIAIVAAAELLEELHELGRRADRCPTCHSPRGCSHKGDCLLERAGLVAQALDGDDKARHALWGAPKRQHRPGSAAQRVAQRADVAAAREAVRAPGVANRVTGSELVALLDDLRVHTGVELTLDDALTVTALFADAPRDPVKAAGALRDYMGSLARPRSEFAAATYTRESVVRGLRITADRRRP